MLKVVEMFSGIGSQKQALSNINIKYEVLSTVEWEIGAIIAYYLMHNGGEINKKILSLSKTELVKLLSEFSLSNDGKSNISMRSLASMPITKLQILYQALSVEERDHFTDITKLKGDVLPYNIDLLTYSFPCQDLSVGSVFHNSDNNGIKKNGGTRSGLLWEIERILDERTEKNFPLPKFLLMENVMQIFSNKHKPHFQEWLCKLEKLGYYNHFSYIETNKKWILNAENFGLPQIRKRAFMLSVKTDNNIKLNRFIENYLNNENNLTRKNVRKPQRIEKFIFLDKYLDEQIKVHPNYTRSRQKIHGKLLENNKKYNSKGNPIIVSYDEVSDTHVFTGDIARTITTKQDRDPNAGLIETSWGYKNNKPYRYLTQRECFALMGFPKEKFELIKESNIRGLDGEKLYKLAGNSICVPILEEIFLAVDHIDKEIFDE